VSSHLFIIKTVSTVEIARYHGDKSIVKQEGALNKNENGNG
jgi:hypothetical protein